MKTIWESEFGEQFETEEDARENMYCAMELSDYIDGLAEKIDKSRLLEWCWMRTDGKFLDDFYDEISDVEDDFFHENYYEVETDEDEEE